MRQWLLDPASIYRATQFSDASAQRRLLARAAEIGKIWPELPGTRQRALLTALIERIDEAPSRNVPSCVGRVRMSIWSAPTLLGQCRKGHAEAADECSMEAMRPDQQLDQPRVGFGDGRRIGAADQHPDLPPGAAKPY